MVAPVIPGLTRSFGVGIAEASLVLVAVSLGSVAATVPAGYLMDRIGRRPVLLAGPVLTALGSLMTPFSGSFLELLFWRFLVGVAAQLWEQGRLLVIADTAPPDQRARQLQWMRGMLRGGQLIGPAVGGLSAELLGIWIPFALHAFLTLAAVLPSLWLVKESAPGRRGRDKEDAALGPQGWGPVIRYVLTFQMLVFLGIQLTAQLSRGGQEQGSLSLYAVYAFNLSPGELGALNTVAIFFGLPVPFLTGYFMDRWGRRAVIAPGFGLYAVSLLFISLTAFFPLPVGFFLVGYVLVQASAGTTGGTMQVLGTDLSPPVNKGRFFAIWRLIAQLGATLAPLAYGLVADNISYGVSFVYLAGCALLVVLGVGVVLGDTQKQPARPDRATAAGSSRW